MQQGRTTTVRAQQEHVQQTLIVGLAGSVLLTYARPSGDIIIDPWDTDALRAPPKHVPGVESSLR